MTFAAAVKLKASRVVCTLATGRKVDLFKMQDSWLERSVEFWRREIRRWADAGIGIVLENETEKSPDLSLRLANEVDDPCLGPCLDIGHQHVFSELGAPEWVRRMGDRLVHIHLHDNDRTGDKHWAIGCGTIRFFRLSMPH